MLAGAVDPAGRVIALMAANRDPVVSLLGPELENGLTGLQNELIGVAGAEFGAIAEGLPNAGGT